MQYGQIINPEYDPGKNHIYEAFVNYFNNPLLIKIKNVETMSMYMVKIHAMLGNAYRYLIIFVPMDFEKLGTEKKMSELEWISLQTRTLEEQHRIRVHNYKPEKKYPLNQKISVVERKENYSVYKAEEFPLNISLLHTRKNQLHQYNPTGCIANALETFQTIINFEDMGLKERI